jgi:hypothetical protein
MRRRDPRIAHRPPSRDYGIGDDDDANDRELPRDLSDYIRQMYAAEGLE